MPTSTSNRVDMILPALRQMCRDSADDIAMARLESEDAFIIAFRPIIRAFVKLPSDDIYGHELPEVADRVRRRIEQVKAACEHAINEVFDKLEESDIEIEFSLGVEPPSPTI